jgi:GntR family transcriptional repressor for pyruvate dehydrogenase complex
MATPVEKAGSDALRPLERTRLYEQLVARLLEHVEEAGLRPGQRLPAERDLAVRLGVSRASVRQALVALEVQGVVGVRHGGGAFLLRQWSADTIGQLRERRRQLPEILEAREALEVQIARLAAQRRTGADLERIEEALQAMERDMAAGGNGVDFDEAFHRAVTQASHNAVLLDLMDHISRQVAEVRIESLSQPGRPARSLRGHRRIADAIAAGDPGRAATAARAHVKLVGDVPLLNWNGD